MTINEMLRKQPDNRRGYMPSEISLTTFDPEGICRKLKHIPNKISAYFYKANIKEVYKSNFTRDPLDNYYIIRATDGTLFRIEY